MILSTTRTQLLGPVGMLLYQGIDGGGSPCLTCMLSRLHVAFGLGLEHSLHAMNSLKTSFWARTKQTMNLAALQVSHGELGHHA